MWQHRVDADARGTRTEPFYFRECHATCPQLTRRLSRARPPIKTRAGLELSWLTDSLLAHWSSLRQQSRLLLLMSRLESHRGWSSWAIDNATPPSHFTGDARWERGSGWAGLLSLESVGCSGRAPHSELSGWETWGPDGKMGAVRVVSPIPEAMTSVVDCHYQQPQGCLDRHTHPSTVDGLWMQQDHTQDVGLHFISQGCVLYVNKAVVHHMFLFLLGRSVAAAGCRGGLSQPPLFPSHRVSTGTKPPTHSNHVSHAAQYCTSRDRLSPSPSIYLQRIYSSVSR